MKSYSYNPSNENVEKLFFSDSIGRQQYIYRFIELLNSIDEGCTIAVSGEWGTGKTFFVKETKMLLDAFNQHTSFDKQLREKIKKYVPEKIKSANIMSTVYYDAWLHDDSKDPLLSLMYTSAVSKENSEISGKEHSLIGIISSVAEVLTGRDFSKFGEELKGNNIFTDIENIEKINGCMKEFLNAMIEERGNRLVIFIDELDRCNPNFSVKLLEQIKHYFLDERITFVFSVNVAELQNTIKRYYGEHFNATRYLDKFFDFRMILPQIDYRSFFENNLDFHDGYTLDEVCIECAKYFQLSLRECERYARLVKIAARLKYRNMLYRFPEEKATFYCVTYFLPIAIALEMTDIEAYGKFIAGIDSGPMWEILSRHNTVPPNALILSQGEFMDDNGAVDEYVILSRDDQENEVRVDLRTRLDDIYNRAFSKGYDGGGYSSAIGTMEFSAETKRKFIELLSLLSPNADYMLE